SITSTCMRDGTIRFWYPHHTGRAVYAAIKAGLVSSESIDYGSRRDSPCGHLQVGIVESNYDF
ncbi:hypothetical protein M1146_05385, partial [Patescibacteria group bacterium]|nr:hypothetical protein [Patescibacteria group bacterium]